MLEDYISNFDMKNIYSEIIKQIPIGCNLLPPNVVILKPGDPSNCNKNVHIACEIYCNNLLDTNLAAYAPLFPVARKFKYASSVAYFLAQVHDDPQLQNLLQIICSVNLTKEGYYFAFNKALETYGIKYTKQNITNNLIDQQTMILKIQAVQNKENYLLILLVEYINNIVENLASQQISSSELSKQTHHTITQEEKNINCLYLENN
ncbi:hypothetical protein F8M41_001472 [Gigaspora margarita]|uniref:Uncharacterized protein n=1 Tax=Gigaspora margarita TaxID=4874 RepID=A0A8H4A993_GIGMA|nr:hypothetical protein F8M41_001472 [Gigaspora margarita]